jgi:hypothetical protein
MRIRRGGGGGVEIGCSVNVFKSYFVSRCAITIMMWVIVKVVL